jgi:hypothetical protein
MYAQSLKLNFMPYGIIKRRTCKAVKIAILAYMVREQ